MVLPIHDVQAPEEIIDPPSAGADGSDLPGVSRDKDACGIGVGISNSPSWQRGSVFGAFCSNARCFRFRSGRGFPSAVRNGCRLVCTDRRNERTRLSIKELDTATGRHLGNSAVTHHVPIDRLHWRARAGGYLGWVGKAHTCRDGDRRFTVNKMLTAHLVDRQKAHDNATGEPNQKLRANYKRQPCVDATGG